MLHPAQTGGEAVVVGDDHGRVQTLEVQNHHRVRVHSETAADTIAGVSESNDLSNTFWSHKSFGHKSFQLRVEQNCLTWTRAPV